MNLLHKHIINIPDNAELVGIYAIDGIVKFVCIKNNGRYHLHKVFDFKLNALVTSHDTLCYFDTYLMNKYMPIVSQSAHNEDGIRIVKVHTTSGPKVPIKKEPKENKPLIHTQSGQRKLF